MFSPFPYDKISSGKSFFGREEEMAVLSKSVQYSNNLLIYSKRRMGKSSLIHHFFENQKNASLCIYVDLFDITSKEDFAKSLLRGVTEATKGDLKSAIKKLTAL
jgi:AAA+ ATPase superfamily predicted ATPase